MIEALNILVMLLQRFEGCRLTAYRDIVGVWTIGWGETLGVTEGMVWTQEHADAELRRRAAQFMVASLKRCPALYLETPGRIAACVSLAYNIGVGAFGASSVSRFTMQQRFQAAADAFLMWKMAAGRVIQGLLNRRIIERLKYLET
jgi:lysozyme